MITSRILADIQKLHKGHSDEVSDGKEGHVTMKGQWRKGNPCYQVAKNLALNGV